MFSCHSSPPYSQNNRDNNYLNLNYEYKGKRSEICSSSKNGSFALDIILNYLQTGTVRRDAEIKRVTAATPSLVKAPYYLKCALWKANEEVLWFYVLKMKNWMKIFRILVVFLGGGEDNS